MKQSWITRASRLAWYVAGLAKTLRASLGGQAFYCKALVGQSDYNICINSDLSLSCNCLDYDGQGHIGDLKHQLLAEVFAGSKATAFRATLAEGKLPILRCGRCSDLTMVSKSQAKELSQRWSLPSSQRTQTTMSDDDMRRVAGMLHDAGITNIDFYNLGEPFLAANVCRQLEILHETCPSAKIAISTNGILLNSDEKRRVALLCDRIAFSIDGMSQEVASHYQRCIRFGVAVENMRNLLNLRRESGLNRPRVVWKYVLFRWNDRPAQIQRAIEMALCAGVDEIIFWRTWSPFYGVSWRAMFGRLNHIGESFPQGWRVVFNP